MEGGGCFLLKGREEEEGSLALGWSGRVAGLGLGWERAAAADWAVSVEGVFEVRGFFWEGRAGLRVDVFVDGCFFLRCFASTALRWAMASLQSSPGQEG